MPAADPALRFVLCADDFALSPGVSQGILEALDSGALSAAGAMTTRPFWRADAQALRPFIGRADLGLHLNLTAGAPLTAMPRLAPGGVLPGVGALIRASLTGRLPEREIRAEIDAQLNAFAGGLGREPDFLDGHQHVHVLPGVRRWALEALARRGLAGKAYVRDSGDGLRNILARRVEAPKALLVSALAQGFAAAARRAGFAANQGFAGFSAFDPARAYAPDFAAFLTNPGPRHLVMCHPGYVDGALDAGDSVTASRLKELAFLASPEFRAVLGARGARSVRFADL